LEYNSKYFDGTNLLQLKPKATALKTFKIKGGIVIGMFQGKKGQRPDLDFVIKILRPGLKERAEAPIHSYWVVDLILKIEFFNKEIRDILTYYLDFYNTVSPFDTIEDRNSYQLKTVKEITDKYGYIDSKINLTPLEYVCTILELFSICEKRNEGAYMFKNLLQMLIDYADNKVDYMHVLKAAQPGF